MTDPHLPPIPPAPAAVVVIGIKEVYDAVRELNGTVATLVTRDAETTRDVADHEARIRALEKNRWPLSPLSSVVSLLALAASVLTVIIMLLRR